MNPVLSARLTRALLALALCAAAACDPERNPVEPEVVVPAPLSFASVSVGQDGGAVCALSTLGAAYCWGGLNYFGNLGTGSVDATERYYGSPLQVTGDLRLRTLSVGNQHACGVAADASAYCWGANDHGQLGNGGAAEASGPPAHNRTPVRVSGGHRWKQVSAGEWVTCGVTEGGEVYCWGWGESGKLGQGALANSAVPVKVAFPT